jgi:hypothetical protein
MQDPNPVGPVICMDSNTDYAYYIVDVIVGEYCVVIYDQFISIGNNVALYS